MVVTLILLSLYTALFTAVGIYFACRYSKDSIRSRSPSLVLISHAALLVFAVLIGIEILIFDQDLGVGVQSAELLLYFTYLLPYLLRGYRLCLIFNLESYIDQSDSLFKQKYYRATQKWLLKMFAIMMIPVFLIATLVMAVPGFRKYMPFEKDRNLISNSVYIWISFLETIAFVLIIFYTRQALDLYKMSRELYMISAIRSVNSFCICLSSFHWKMAIIIQNTLIMLISSFWPLVLSFRKARMNDSITYEVSENMELILLNSSALNAFEGFLRSLPEGDRTRGEDLLQLWYRISTYNYNPQKCLIPKIAELQEKCLLGNDYEIERTKELVLNTLKDNYFEKFKKSIQFKLLQREIKVMEVFYNRIAITYIAGKKPSSPYESAYISTIVSNRL